VLVGFEPIIIVSGRPQAWWRSCSFHPSSKASCARARTSASRRDQVYRNARRHPSALPGSTDIHHLMDAPAPANRHPSPIDGAEEPVLLKTDPMIGRLQKQRSVILSRRKNMKKLMLYCICGSWPLVSVVAQAGPFPSGSSVLEKMQSHFSPAAVSCLRCHYPDGDRWGPGRKVCTDVCKGQQIRTPAHTTTVKPNLPPGSRAVQTPAHPITPGGTRVLNVPPSNSPKLPGKP
jgi:hypothetical protein